MAAVDDLTELVEKAAAAERTALASKWKERADVEKMVRNVRKSAETQRTDLAAQTDASMLSSRWVSLRQDYLDQGAQQDLPEHEPTAQEVLDAEQAGRTVRRLSHSAAAQAERDAVAAVQLARLALNDAALAVLQARLARIDAGEDDPDAAIVDGHVPLHGRNPVSRHGPALAHGLTGEIRYILTRKPRATVKSLAITLALGLLYLGWIRLAEWDKESRFLPYLGLWVTGGSAVSTAQDPPGDAEGDHRLQGERGDEGVRAGGRPASRRAISNKPRRPLPADMWGLRVKG